MISDDLEFGGRLKSERSFCPLPAPPPTGEGVDVGMSRMLWAGSKAKVSLRPVWLLRAS